VSPMDDTQAMRRELDDLKALLFLKTPYLALLLSKMRIAVSHAVRTVLATPNGETIVNPDFWGKLRNREEKTFVLVHEALHLAFRHPWTVQGRDRALFNVAADVVVNEMLFRHGYHEAAGNPVTAPMVREMLWARNVPITVEELRRASSDEIYRLLVSARAQDTAEQMLNDAPRDLNPEESEPPDTEKEIVQEGSQGPGEDPEEYWRATVVEAVVVAQAAGTSPGELQRVVEESLKPRVNWRSQLKNGLRDAVGRTVVCTWERPSRRYATFPGIKRLGVQTVWALVDCSGSITERALAQFVAEVWALSRVFRCELRVLPWDAAAYPEIRVYTPGQVQARVVSGLWGGGGTLLAPALRRLQRRMRAQDVVVIISDGHIGDLENAETLRLYRMVSRKAAGLIFLTSDRYPDLPHTRVIDFR